MPVASAFLSPSWAPKEERADDGVTAGIIDGTQKYSKGAAPDWATAQAYCGTSDDFQGTGDSPPLEYDDDAGPDCCQPPPAPDVFEIEISFTSNVEWVLRLGGAGNYPVPNLMRAGNFIWSYMQAAVSEGIGFPPWAVYLCTEVVNDPPDTLDDIIQPNFVGYVPVPVLIPAPIQDPDYLSNQLQQLGPFLFKQTGSSPASRRTVTSYVVADDEGNVLLRGDFQTSLTFYQKGDYINVYINLSGIGDYA